MDHPPGEVDTNRRSRNWRRQQRRKAARQKARIRYLALRNDFVSTKDPDSAANVSNTAGFEVTDSSKATVRLQKLGDSTQRAHLAGLQTAKSKDSSKPSEGDMSDGTTRTRSTTPPSGTDGQHAVGTNRRAQLISGIQMRIRRLERLHELRTRLAAKHPTGSTEMGDKTFTQAFDALTKRLKGLLAEIDKVEADDPDNGRPLRKTRADCGRADRKHGWVRHIEEALFGGKRQIVPRSKVELVDVRRQWDAYENSEGQTVPVRWVEAPKEPADDEWFEYLVQ